MTPEGIPPQDREFAELVVRQRICSREDVEACFSVLLRLQEAGVEPLPTLGELLVRKGFMAGSPSGRTLQPAQGNPEPAAPADGARLPKEAADAALDPQNLFGNFILIRQVGQGGFGAVYRAWQRDLGRSVALKFLHSDDEGDVQRFVREAQTAAKLQHPHIVPIYEVGDHQGRNYLAMEFVDGETLNRIRLGPKRAVEVMREVALAVQYAHERGIIHRDLKPQNLMMGKDGHVWVLDFGLARQLSGGATLTVSGAVVGTPAYMPPEQAQGNKCDERSDVYSLGATLYELLTGRQPFEATTPLEVLKKLTESDPTAVRKLNSKVHSEVETIVAKAMEKSPARRYATAKEFQEDLRRHLEGEPILARPSTLLSRGMKWVKRHRMASAVGLVIVAAALLLGLGGVFYLVNLDRARVAAENAALRERAEAERARSQERTARLEFLHGLVSQGEALGRANRWEGALERHAQAREGFERLGVSTLPAELGLWEVSRHYSTPVMTFPGHQDRVLSVAFSPDSARALTASKDRTVKLWEVETGRELRTLRGHRELVRAVAFSPDGKRAVSGDNVGDVKLWDLETGREIRTVQDSEQPILCVGFSPDGATMFSSGAFGPLTLRDVKSGDKVRTFGGNPHVVTCAAFLAGGKRLLSGSYDKTLKLWEVETGRELRTFAGHAHAVLCLALSPDGRAVVSGGGDGSVRLWGIESGREERILVRIQQTASTHGVAFSPDGTRVLAGFGDGALRLLDVESGEEVRTLAGTSGMIISVALSPDGRWALSGGVDPAPRLWALGDGRHLRAVKTPPGFSFASAFSPDGRLAVWGGADHSLKLWDVETARQLGSWSGHEGNVQQAVFSSDGTRVLSASLDGTLKLWDVETGRDLRTFMGHRGPVLGVAYFPDGRRAFSGSDDQELKIWDVASGQVLRTLTGHSGRVQSVALSPDGTCGLSGSLDKTLKLWDLSTGREIRTFTGHTGGVNVVAFAAGRRRVLSGSSDRTLRVWDAETGRELHTLRGHEQALVRISVSPDGTWAISSGFDAMVKVWDLEAGREIHTFAAPGSVPALALSPDGTVALSISGEGTLEFRDFSVPARDRRLEPDVLLAFQSLRERPGDGPSLSVLSRWYASHGDLGGAIDCLERARRSGASVSPLALGRYYWQRGDLRAAEREFLGALKLKEAPESYINLCLQAVGRRD